MSIYLVYMTAGSEDEARRIGRDLVSSRLAACVNILPGMNSIYRWQGALQEDKEVVLIAKTTGDRIAALTEKVQTLHGHDCPCVVTLPVAGGSPAFLEWIAAETVEKHGEP